jgi:hypothetical protein
MVAVPLSLESVASQTKTKKYAGWLCCSWRFCPWAFVFFVCLAGASAVRQMGQLLASDQCWHAAVSVLPPSKRP